MKTPMFIEKIDWSELRNQKRLLILANDKLVDQEQKDAIEGILNLIDAVQDYAVDEMGMNSNDIYDFEQEDNELESGGTMDGHITPEITKTIWVCSNCGSSNVQFKTWTDANTFQATNDECPMEDEDCYCKDCLTHGKLITKIIPLI